MAQCEVPALSAKDQPGALYDARKLGMPKMALFGLQHMFAMLVPVLTGLSVQATLLFAGLGTLLFHFLSKGVVPAFLGSSFAFIAGYAAIAPNGDPTLLPYACLGVACAGLLYPVLAALFKAFGAYRVMRFFPPIVTGPIVISIGLILAGSAITNCSTNWLVAVIAIAVIIVCNIWGRGMIRIIPIMMGIIVSYIVALITGAVDFSGVTSTLSNGFVGGIVVGDVICTVTCGVVAGDVVCTVTGGVVVGVVFCTVTVCIGASVCGVCSVGWVVIVKLDGDITTKLESLP